MITNKKAYLLFLMAVVFLGGMIMVGGKVGFVGAISLIIYWYGIDKYVQSSRG